LSAASVYAIAPSEAPATWFRKVMMPNMQTMPTRMNVHSTSRAVT
jgi:hypothetical protein